MVKITLKEFKDKSNIEVIESIMKLNNGYATSKELSNFDIHRMYLKIMKEKSIIEKSGNKEKVVNNFDTLFYYLLLLVFMSCDKIAIVCGRIITYSFKKDNITIFF